MKYPISQNNNKFYETQDYGSIFFHALIYIIIMTILISSNISLGHYIDMSVLLVNIDAPCHNYYRQLNRVGGFDF